MAPNAVCTINVTFRPTATYYSSTLTITDSAGNSPQVVMLTGRRSSSRLHPQADSDFPNRGINSTSSGYTITLTNNEATSISISSIAVLRTVRGDEHVRCKSRAWQELHRDRHVLSARRLLQYYSAAITVTDTGSNSPQSIPVTGNGVLPISTRPNGRILLYHQVVNTPSTPQVVTLTNQQGSAIAFNGITSSPRIPFTSNCGSSLAGGATCTIQVTFNPSAITTYNANLIINNNSSIPQVVIPPHGNRHQRNSAAHARRYAHSALHPTPIPIATVLDYVHQHAQHGRGDNWYVNGVHGGNSTVGIITTSGLYTAPPWRVRTRCAPSARRTPSSVAMPRSS